MAEGKEESVDWKKLSDNAKKVHSDLGQALKALGNENVSDFSRMSSIFSERHRRKVLRILRRQTLRSLISISLRKNMTQA